MAKMRFKSDKKGRRDVLAAISLLSQIGISMAICIGGTLWLGHWIDTKAGTSPLFLLIMLALGFGGAISSLMSMTRRFYAPLNTIKDTPKDKPKDEPKDD